MKSTTLKLILTGVGLILIFFSPADAELSLPLGIGLIGVAWLEKW
jgi:hypothetical protein